MPRQPTGRPRGRPKGSGELGEQMRLTVRIPLALYERLTAFAEGHSYSRRAPQLAICVREALEEYLDNKRQTQNYPAATRTISGQTENIPLPQEENNRQTKNIAITSDDINRQTIKVPEGAKDNYGQTKKDTKPQAANLRQTKKGRGARRDLSGRILALLGSYPQGLTASELRVYLKPEKPIGDTLQGMERTGKLRGVGSGQQKRYFLA